MKLLIRDDGVVFGYDNVLAAEKDMRLASPNEVARYKECLENKEKFVPDRPGTVSFQQEQSDWALDLSNGELTERTPGLCSGGEHLILTEAQAQYVRNYIDGKEVSPSEDTVLDSVADLDAMNVPQLRKYAKETFNIGTEQTVTKAELLALIKMGQNSHNG